MTPHQARNTRSVGAPRSAVMRIRSRTKQIWASRTSGTGLLKSLLAATAKISIPSPSAMRTQLAASGRRPIERIAVRPLAVDLDPVIAVLLGPGDHLGQGESLAAIPEAQVGDAVESQFHRDSFLVVCATANNGPPEARPGHDAAVT